MKKTIFFMLFALLFVYSVANAEYYLVYSAPPCYYPYHYRHYHHYHHRVHHYYHRYGTSIYYIYPGPPPCPCHTAWTVIYQTSPDVVTFSGRPPRYDGNYVEDDNRNYDPDMSTADDNASIHPDMDIDY